jgi:Uma2 family endonuclease
MKPYTDNPEKTISQFNEIDLSGTYSYAHYLRWAFDERLELIKGKIFRMSPAPARRHQEISQEINRHFLIHLKGKPCKVYAAPFDVRLPIRKKKSTPPKDQKLKSEKNKVDDKEITTVVQPDLCVVCDPEKLDDRGCIGAPDIVVEILSPGNNSKEIQNKYEVYEETGVKEYWIVWPEEKTFMKYVLDDQGKFQPSRVMTIGETVTTPILPGFELELDEVFLN